MTKRDANFAVMFGWKVRAVPKSQTLDPTFVISNDDNAQFYVGAESVEEALHKGAERMALCTIENIALKLDDAASVLAVQATNPDREKYLEALREFNNLSGQLHNYFIYKPL